MNKKALFDIMGNIDDEFVLESADINPVRRINRKISALAAALAVVIIAAAGIIIGKANIIPVEGSENVKIVEIDKLPKINSVISNSLAFDLSDLTLDEIFNDYCTDAFKGTVESVTNIKICYDTHTEYDAVALIKVEKVYKGSVKKGDTVKVLLGCPIYDDGEYAIWIEDTDTVSNIKAGVSGIFMPKKCDNSTYCIYGNSKFMYGDIAQYMFSDGVRFAFLQTQDGLIFDKYTYGEKIKDAKNLDDIEAFIIENLS